MTYILRSMICIWLAGIGCAGSETGPDAPSTIYITLGGLFADDDTVEVFVDGLVMEEKATGRNLVNVIVAPGEHRIEGRSVLRPDQAWRSHIVRVGYGESAFDTLSCEPAWIFFTNECADSLAIEIIPLNRFIVQNSVLRSGYTYGFPLPSGETIFAARNGSGVIVDSGTTPFLQYGESFQYKLKCP